MECEECEGTGKTVDKCQTCFQRDGSGSLCTEATDGRLPPRPDYVRFIGGLADGQRLPDPGSQYWKVAGAAPIPCADHDLSKPFEYARNEDLYRRARLRSVREEVIYVLDSLTTEQAQNDMDDGVPLDPATCLALMPIHDMGNQAMKERDAWNKWSVVIARRLNVSCSDFASEEVADQYAELRDRITQALNAEVSDRRAHAPENTTGANGGSLH